MESFRIFLDTDVLINWLAKEIDPNTGFDLWRCPYAIIELIERREIVGHTSLTNIFEVRFVLRRKKRYSEGKNQGMHRKFIRGDRNRSSGFRGYAGSK